MEIAYYCMDNPSHRFGGENLDGIRCPYCDGSVNIKPVSSEEYKELPMYRELKRKHKHIKRNPKSIEIAVDMNTDNLQLKLRAIAKHAEALADELDHIDAAKCDKCVGLLDITTLSVDGFPVEEIKVCTRCGSDD